MGYLVVKKKVRIDKIQEKENGMEGLEGPGRVVTIGFVGIPRLDNLFLGSRYSVRLVRKKFWLVVILASFNSPTFLVLSPCTHSARIFSWGFIYFWLTGGSYRLDRVVWLQVSFFSSSFS